MPISAVLLGDGRIGCFMKNKMFVELEYVTSDAKHCNGMDYFKWDVDMDGWPKCTKKVDSTIDCYLLLLP